MNLNTGLCIHGNPVRVVGMFASKIVICHVKWSFLALDVLNVHGVGRESLYEECFD